LIIAEQQKKTIKIIDLKNHRDLKPQYPDLFCAWEIKLFCVKKTFTPQ
jgi:hypothetical protein